MRTIVPAALALALASAACDDGTTIEEPLVAERQFDVLIENFTRGQPFSPGLAVTHGDELLLWSDGAPSTRALRRLAEHGDPAELPLEVAASRAYEVITLRDGVDRVGGDADNARQFRIRAGADATRLSVAMMLVCTNDGFTGVAGVPLPEDYEPVVFLLPAWDAGAELNDERFASIVDACQAAGPVTAGSDGDGGEAEDGVVAPHPNIQGEADLSTELHGWDGPVGRLSIRRAE